MVFFIVLLRAIAACLITNSHYSLIYPISALGSGGLLGDILFFAISGWCLYNVKESFPRWYAKRISRVYPPVIIFTAVCLLCGLYHMWGMNFFEMFIYPTQYHFVASIIVLYVLYYFVVKVKHLRNNLPLLMLGVAVVHIAIYFFFFDKTYYHIDTVEEPMIRFFFFEGMLLGAWFRHNDKKFRNCFRKWDIPMTVLLVAAHLAYKSVFVKIESLLWLQIINQGILLALLYFVMRLFAGLDAKLEKMPAAAKKAIGFVAGLTLEIYVVQQAIIPLLQAKFAFPINWIVVTAAILAAAYALHKLWELFLLGVRKIYSQFRKSKT